MLTQTGKEKPEKGEEWQAEESADGSLLTVQPVALLPLPAQRRRRLLQAEAYAEAQPPPCRTGTWRGRGREAVVRLGARVSEPQGKRRTSYECFGG